jgi:hypothetical protein
LTLFMRVVVIVAVCGTLVGCENGNTSITKLLSSPTAPSSAADVNRMLDEMAYTHWDANCGSGTLSTCVDPAFVATLREILAEPTSEVTRIISLSSPGMARAKVGTEWPPMTVLSIWNHGNSALTWSGLSTGNEVFTADETSGVVGAGEIVGVYLTFTPTAATSYSSTLTVTSDATNGSNTITLSGTGLAADFLIPERVGSR